MNVTLKLITNKDQVLITKILTKSFNFDTQLYFGKDQEDGPPGYNDGTLALRILTEKNWEKWFILEKETVIGLIVLDSKQREVRYFCVFPEFIGQGYGTAVWKKIENRFGSENWLLETPAYSLSNHFFYEKLGFEKDGKKDYGEGSYSIIFKK
ncbi:MULTISPECIES: GNAT family N-acetyltransferase [Vagococcus]|uniref:GCN5-related N-acetyltransferase n=1 Tax=Vagococcus fluvialis bH819 TaxID=1255619 RepID=A0A1X6WRA7_9ENTE|nr:MULTISPECIES: GNAT family N-acetyltransferase [Vagococcus]SLM86824.1 GCN5-related N-acetyltransferase [Vagococcus fluvialis bH819]HCM88718.1 N-acetyltransferase [Vagococcus sp.]